MTAVTAFADRASAGSALAAALAAYGNRDDVLVLGLPRGGVPVAAEIASSLGAPLDVMPVRKLGAPGQPELAIGAIASGGVILVNENILSATASAAEVQSEILAAVGHPAPARLVERWAYYDLAAGASVVVSTGERRFWANVILYKGLVS